MEATEIWLSNCGQAMQTFLLLVARHEYFGAINKKKSGKIADGTGDTQQGLIFSNKILAIGNSDLSQNHKYSGKNICKTGLPKHHVWPYIIKTILKKRY